MTTEDNGRIAAATFKTLTEKRLADLERANAEQAEKLEAQQKIINDQKVEIAKLQERLTIFAALQATLTIVVGAVASGIAILLK